MPAHTSSQPLNLPLVANPLNYSGGTYIVTGANKGLGYEAAKHLVALGSTKVILAVRNLEAGETAKGKIEKETGKPGIAEVWLLDLASYDSVKAFAKRVLNDLDCIDGVIENAAIAVSQGLRAEGHLLSLTVNVYSTFLLAVLLLPKLKESAKKFGILPHLSIVSSGVGFDTEEEWEVMKTKDDPIAGVETETLKSYPLSKLLVSMGVKHIAPLLPVSNTGVVINLVCPGLCVTDLARNAPVEFKDRLATAYREYGRTAEDGSRTLLHGAVAGKESHGLFLESCEMTEEFVPSWVTDEEGQKSQKRVWELIAKELESIEPGCVGKIW